MNWPKPLLNDSDNDDARYFFVDHRSEDGEIVRSVSNQIQPEHMLDLDDEDETGLTVTYCGRKVIIPLTISAHDRYVTISSLADILQEHYRFFVEEESLQSDTHALFLAPLAELRSSGPHPRHLMPLQLGFDYFSGDPRLGAAIRVPYLDHVAPDFVSESQTLLDHRRAAGAITEAMLSGLMSGSVDPAKIDEIARQLAADPKLRAEMSDKSEAEIAAELHQAMQMALAEPEVRASRRDMASALNELRALTGAPPLPVSKARPWWKFW
jgi:hypothetical protein